MKKFLLMIVLIAGVMSVSAQSMYVSSEKRQTCYWNEALSKFSGCGDIESYESLFVLNGDATIFTHTTSKIKSSYYVKDKVYNKEKDLTTYDVVSDVGNKYQFIIGDGAVNFVILSTGHAKSEDDYIIKFPIKRKWKD